MDTPSNPWIPGDDGVTGTPEELTSTTRTHRTGRAIALVAAGAIAATVVSGIAFASNNNPDPANQGQAQGGVRHRDGDRGGGMMGDREGGPGMGGPGMGGPGGKRGGMMGDLGMLAAGANVLHGEVVVKKADGTTVTIRVQGGTVKSASASELIVTSSDGVEQTWPLTDATHIHRGAGDAKAADIAAGDTVTVIGEVSGSTVTTVRVEALSPEQAAARQKMKDKWNSQRQQGNGEQSPVPGPTR
ncbi:MAG: hypothetical protein NTZ03_16405 [Actinobacteria bacterium]|nr:hypothetical protein [Actinomycetota bacterium]